STRTGVVAVVDQVIVYVVTTPLRADHSVADNTNTPDSGNCICRTCVVPSPERSPAVLWDVALSGWAVHFVRRADCFGFEFAAARSFFLREGWIVSCRAHMATNRSMRSTRVSGFFAVWTR